MPFFLPSVVTQKNALQIQREGLLNAAALKTVNCSALKEFDSTVLAVLLAWHKKLKLNGESLVVEHAPEKLRVLASVYGISALLDL
jgi:phospholipid transport system transporter-binding protein